MEANGNLDRSWQRLRGQLEGEGRALARLRLDPDAPVHRLDELAADVQAEARSADAPPLVGIQSIELVEDPLLLAYRDAEALILDAEAKPVAHCSEPHLDSPPGRRVLDRVVEQIEQHLARALAIPMRLRHHRRHDNVDRRLLPHPRPPYGHDSPHDLLWVERVRDHAERPAVELGRDQDLLDEVGETV